MQPYQEEFIRFALANGALAFGSYTLKSGRISPYFFNVGKFVDGATLAQLGRFYADAIHHQFPTTFDVIFGPAYKGIQIATCTAIELARNYQCNYAVSFNRKEPKDHGEGGLIVGASLQGKRVLIIDDVITAGTAFREAMVILKQENATVVGIVTALDRQEVGQQLSVSAIDEIKREFNIPVVSIIKRDNLIEYAAQDTQLNIDVTSLEKYKDLYGC